MRQGFEEQNEAAGGAHRRQLRTADGTIVTAMVAVRTLPKTRQQLYAYLQFKSNGKTTTKYIGRVTSESRAAAMKLGWKLLRERKLVESCGWSWVTRPRG